MMMWVAVTKAVLTRLLFAGHVVAVVCLVVRLKSDESYYYLSLIILAQVVEGAFTMLMNKGEEWKWFCPGVAVYLFGSVPAIWLLELELLDLRLATRRTHNGNTVDDASKNLGDIAEWVLVTEQMLPLLLIVGRWLLPKGATSRDELSQLLLVYFATASDIIEFFDGFKEPAVKYDRSLVITLLTLWSWSLLQFALVMTATRSAKVVTSEGDSEVTTPAMKRRLQRAVFKRFPRLAASRVVAPVRPAPIQARDEAVIPVKPEHEVREDTTPTFTCLDTEVWSLVASILLQDGPFLVFRVALILHFQVYSHTNIFFTCKNLIVILLQSYRIIVLYSDRKERLKTERRSREKMERRIAALKNHGFNFPQNDDLLFAERTSDMDPYLAAMLSSE